MKKRILSVAMSLTFVVLCFAGLAFSGSADLALTPTDAADWHSTWGTPAPDVVISDGANGAQAVFGTANVGKGIEFNNTLSGSWTVSGTYSYGVPGGMCITFRNSGPKLIVFIQANADAVTSYFYAVRIEGFNGNKAFGGSDDRTTENLAPDPNADGGWLKNPGNTAEISWVISHEDGTSTIDLALTNAAGAVLTENTIDLDQASFDFDSLFGEDLIWGVQANDNSADSGTVSDLQISDTFTAMTTASSDTTAAGGSDTTSALIDNPTTAADWTLTGGTATTLSGQYAAAFARGTAGQISYVGPTQIAGNDLYLSFDVKYNGEPQQVEYFTIWVGNSDINLPGVTDGVFTRIGFSPSNGQFILNTQLFKNDWTSGMAATGTGNFNNWTDCATASPTGTLHVVMTYTAGTDTVHLKLTMGGTTVYDISLTQAGAGAAMNKAACLIISNDVGGASKTTVGNAFVLNAPPRTGGSTVTGQTLPIAIVALCTLSASAVGVVMLRARKQRDDA